MESDHGEPFARILVKPSAKVSRAREVLLVWPERQEADAAQMSALDQDVEE